MLPEAAKRMTGEPVMYHQAYFDVGLASIIDKMIKPDISERYKSTEELFYALHMANLPQRYPFKTMQNADSKRKGPILSVNDISNTYSKKNLNPLALFAIISGALLLILLIIIIILLMQL